MYIWRGRAVKYSMIVAKFGGTAVTPRNLKYVKRLAAGRSAIVVSAVGREFKSDVKATDLLLGYFDSGNEALWAAFADKYRRLAVVNAINADVDALLAEAHARALCCGRDYCASLGEELSARLAAKFLGGDYVEAQDVVLFDKWGNLLQKETYLRVRQAFEGKRCAVMGGFYGGCTGGGRRTFSRGGGDVSGALVAAAMGANLYENWTDVYGVCVADPSKVHNAATVEGLSYRQMRLLSDAGAEVLHPDAVSPCEQAGIPLRIGNFFNPEGASTLVSACPCFGRLLSVAEKFCDGKVVTTVLHSYPLWQATQIAARFLHAHSRLLPFDGGFCPIEPNICLQTEAQTLRFCSETSILAEVYRAFYLD